MTDHDIEVEAFLAAYVENWTTHRDSLDEIFHPEGRLRVPGRAEPLTPDQATQMIAETRRLLPDVSIEILHWAEREGNLYIEWEMAATIEGHDVRWGGINRNTLRGRRSIDAVSHWDRQTLNDQLAALEVDGGLEDVLP